MKILGTTQISNQIEFLLEEANQYLVLVTPYLKLNQRLKVHLSDAIKRTDKTFFIFRKDKEKEYKETLLWLSSFKNTSIIPVKNLHSKIYANENGCLITSMNLYEYSQINNHEIGVTINSETEEYKDVVREIRLMIETEVENHPFNEILDGIEDYTMGRLYFNLYRYNFKNHKKETQERYVYVCNHIRKLVDFTDNELYQDKTAILRETKLGKERYNILEKELKKLAK